MDSTSLSLDMIHVDANKNARQVYHPDKVEEIRKSILHVGQLNPLIVRMPSEKLGGKYELIAGFTRYKAMEQIQAANEEKAKEKGKDSEQFVAKVQVFTGSDLDAECLNLEENINRADLTTYEIARACHRMSKTYKLSGEEVGKRVGGIGKSQANKYVNLIEKLHPVVQEAWKNGHKLCRTDNLVNNFVTLTPAEQLKEWEKAIGVAPGSDGKGGEKGGAETPKPKFPTPSKKRILATVKLLKEDETLEIDDSAEWLIEALMWCAGAGKAPHYAAEPAKPGAKKKEGEKEEKAEEKSTVGKGRGGKPHKAGKGKK